VTKFGRHRFNPYRPSRLRKTKEVNPPDSHSAFYPFCTIF